MKIIHRVINRVLMLFGVPYLDFLNWYKQDFRMSPPKLISWSVMRRWGYSDAIWVESGTFKGDTTNFLANYNKKVHSIEPHSELYMSAKKRFSGRKNIELYNGASEDVFPRLVPKLSGKVCFWLDGHFSGPLTFQAAANCPIETELKTISKNIGKFSDLVVLIDDLRRFAPGKDRYEDYPSLDSLIDWARDHNLNWNIESDILIMWKPKQLNGGR